LVRAQKRPADTAWRQRHQHFLCAGIAFGIEPDLRTVARKAEASEHVPLSQQRVEIGREVVERLE
jgi:hypothetical protein